MAKSRNTSNLKGSLGVLAGLGIIIAIGAYALSHKSQIKSKLDETVFGSGGSTIDESSTVDPAIDSSAPAVPHPTGVTQQLTSFLDRLQRPQTPTQQFVTPQQPSSKPALSAAVSNYNKIIQSAISSGYSGIPNKSVYSKSSRGHVTRTVTKNKPNYTKGRGNPSAKIASNSSITNRINNLRSSKSSPKSSRTRRPSRTVTRNTKKKAEENRATATRKRLYGF